ncbi:hypothetical protein EDC94DRAFT_401370 [Helicostylum pulchrum]|uniref:Uncharacterized protein n=1 Tax=Helicostylum pulchrum TaxID=562976 RepID=A0ABP9XXD8_9FUNG|nr:hypothetical protein EDC94DRAFT_401370 [Helicostylum pulchrum]
MEQGSLQKRGGGGSEGGGSTFATYTEHTPVFNTVHIIAAVIGIIGAIGVAVTVLLFYRKRKSTDNLLKVKADIEQNMIERIPSDRRRATTTTTTITSDRFGQFASDFDNNVQPPKPAVMHVEDISPMMQQYQLQLKLLEVPTHNRAASSSSSSMSHPTCPPPPPYQP